MDKFEVKILGCGSATPTARHLPSCQVVDIRDTLYMIDCGEGAQLQARKMGIKFNRLRHIFLSHLHGDHCLGLVGLLSTLSLHHIDGEITVHTFAPGAEMFKRMIEFFCHELTFTLNFNIIEPKRAIIVDTPAITVETIPLYHRIPTVGYIFREKPKVRHLRRDMLDFYNVPISQRHNLQLGADFVTPEGAVIPNARLTTDPTPPRSYAYCSDTMFDPRVAHDVGPVTTMYHEATYADDSAEKARARYHSTARQAGEIARMAQAQRLVIGHYSKSYPDESLHLAQAKEAFGGEVIAATEGMCIKV